MVSITPRTRVSHQSTYRKTALSVTTRPLFVVLLLAFATNASSLRFYLHDRERRCFRFEAPYDSRVRGHAMLSNGRGSAELTLEIHDNMKKTIFHSHYDDPKKSVFSFMTPRFDPAHHADKDIDDLDDYEYDPRELEGWFDACLVLSIDSSHDSNARRAVSLWFRPEDFYDEHDNVDTNAADSEVVSVSRQLEDVQSALNHMVGDIVSLQQRERRLVDHNRYTTRRLLVLAFVSLLTLVLTSALQYMHFKTYFKSKKLL